MTVTITPAGLAGRVTPPPSKSRAHRQLIAAALAQGESFIGNVALSQDIAATRGCLEELGAGFEETSEGLRVCGLGAGPMSPRRRMALPRLDCGESGSTLRFLIPVALAVAGGGVFTGRGRLMERPQGPYQTLFRERGIFWERQEGALTVRGELTPGEYRLPGNVSSQFLTGLLYALPLLEGDSELILTTPLESESYVFMTLEALGDAGVRVTGVGGRFLIPGAQRYRPHRGEIEPDWSQAAFWYAANALGCRVEVEGMDLSSSQGDRAVLFHCRELSKPGDVEINVSQCPDLLPPLAAAAAVRRGTTRLVGAARLRMKESDRLSAVTQTLNALGARVEEHADSLTIRGTETLKGGAVVDCRNDHRIAMMAAVAAVRCREPVTLEGAECVEKSYPDFWEHYQSLGGELYGLVCG